MLAGGLFLFIGTNYVGRTNIIVIGVLARFLNGIVNLWYIHIFL